MNPNKFVVRPLKWAVIVGCFWAAQSQFGAIAQGSSPLLDHALDVYERSHDQSAKDNHQVLVLDDGFESFFLRVKHVR